MNVKYDEILKKAKEFNYRQESYNRLKEIVKIAKRAKLPFNNLDTAKVKDEIEFAISLTGATALCNAYEALGDDGYIVYLNKEGQLVRHYADGKIEFSNE
ncbi:hypothetical protein P4679_24595 [Priestia megaterium]|uniref:hypothetical protein n=1 Tax=Priestia megaterium TaxID=1404 RepID=UPI002E2333CB|nr:hypothetical protein [Priestia megaterium]